MAKKAKIGISDQLSQADQVITINLASQEGQLVNVGTGFDITVEPERSFLIFGTQKHIERTINISLLNLKVPIEIIGNRQAMFTASVGTSSYPLVENRPVAVELTDRTNPFALYFNTGAVTDYTVQQKASNSAFVSFDISLTDEIGQTIDTVPVRIKLDFARVANEPIVKFERMTGEVIYNPEINLMDIGTLVISNPGALQFLPNLNIECEFEPRQDGKPVPVIFLDTDACVDRVESKKGGNAIYIDDFGNKIRNKNNVVKIPIKANVGKIGNPCNTELGKVVYDLDLKVTYSTVTEPDVLNSLHVEPVTFTVKENVSQPSLGVVFEDPRTHQVQDVTKGGHITIEQFQFLPGDDFVLPLKLTVHNYATQGVTGSGIVIRDVKREVLMPKNAKAKYVRGESVESFVELDGPKSTSVPNAKNSRCEYEIIINGRCVRDLYCDRDGERNYTVPVTVDISFKYCLDEKGRFQLGMVPDSEFEEYRLRVTVPVYQLPNLEWLAIDFGTSAIVGEYASVPINLHDQKDKYLDRDTISKDQYEKGTPFLSSNLVLTKAADQKINMSALLLDRKDQVNQEGLGELLKQLALRLSPDTTTELANADYVLPCLKLLVGYSILPNLAKYSSYKYKYLDDEVLVENGLVEPDPEDPDNPIYTPLANIKTIFSEVYKQLFTFYLGPAISENARKINKIVLTVPNTYTPVHLRLIRSIIKDALSSLNVREVKFVSESDAVACLYVHRWMKFNQALKRADGRMLTQRENVLVYDMGAGTLDVTFFTKSLTKEGTIKIRIRGKIGIAKAGNYLDALLAQLLAKKVKSFQNFADPDKIDSGDRLKAALNLKALVKNEIKPLLSLENPGTYVIKENRELGVRDSVTIDLQKDILDTKEFKDYIKEVTDDFLNNFFKFYAELAGARVDTVIVSGRSAKLKAIQTSLDQAIKRWSAPVKAPILYLSDWTEADSKFDLSKTAVVEGAANFADFTGKDSSIRFYTPSIMARYGVIYEDIHGAIHYEELLTPEMAEKLIQGDESGEFSTEEKVLDLSSSSKIMLVQTFSANTAEDWVKGEREYITPISEVDARSIRERNKARLSLQIDKDSVMELYINGQRRSGISSFRIDISSKSNKMSLWPIIK